MTLTLEVVLPESALLPWSSQVGQYPEVGVPGVSYMRGDMSEENDEYVDCLMWRDEDGKLRGVLNHYPQDLPPFEKTGNYNLFTDDEQDADGKYVWRRRGIGMALLTEADKRWHLNFAQQDYTPSGAELVKAYFMRGRVVPDDVLS